MGIARYPGGKAKLRDQISDSIDSSWECLEYREPFFGGGGIGMKVLEKHPKINRIWINDLDVGIACLWTAIIQTPEYLQQLIKEFAPSTDAFYEFKGLLLEAEMPKTRLATAEIGFKKLAIHQISYSGLGTMSGSPLGGVEQKSKYPVDCRWSPDFFCKKIAKYHEKLSRYSIHENRCTNIDFSPMIKEGKTKALLMLDPPYYVKGGSLYQCSFREEDHDRMASLLKNTKHEFILTYDDCDRIRDLYRWAEIRPLDVKYSITALKDKESGQRLSRTKGELLIRKQVSV